MPKPEDAFDDEDAPPIPQLGDSGHGGADISDEARERAQQEAARQNRSPETQQFLDTIQRISSGSDRSNQGEEDRISRGVSAAQSVGISANGEGGSIGELLVEVRAIRSAIESLLNS